MGPHRRAAMAHSIPEGASRPLIDVIHSKSLFQLGQQHLRRGSARLQLWRTIGHKGFVGMDMRLDKPWEYQLASHLELFVGYAVEPRSDCTNTPLLNSDVLRLSSDKTALHNQIVHAASWLSSSEEGLQSRVRLQQGVQASTYSDHLISVAGEPGMHPLWAIK